MLLFSMSGEENGRYSGNPALQRMLLASAIQAHFQRSAGPSNAPQPSGPGLPTRLMGALNEGIADTFGQPVDLVNYGLKAIGVPTAAEPIMGSDWISGAMHGLNMGAYSKSYAPQSGAEHSGQTLARGFGQAAVPFGGWK